MVVDAGTKQKAQPDAPTQESERRSKRARLPVCVLDDDIALLKVTALLLEQAGFPPVVATSDPEVALRGIREGSFRAVLVDVKMPGIDGFSFLEKSLEIDPTVNVILVTGFYSIEAATSAIKRGASDYLSKPVDRSRLLGTLDDLADLIDQKHQVRELEQQILLNSEFMGLVGKSSAMLEVFDRIRHVARHCPNVLITAPPGAGKEMVARALHAAGPNRDGKFESFVCSAFEGPGNGGSSHGSERGARQDTDEALRALETLHSHKNSTLYFDEISDMPAAFQTRLLALLPDKPSECDPRVISASRRDMRLEIAAGRFREDLFFRLSPIEIRVPPISERSADVPLLLQFFLSKYNAQFGKHFRGVTRRAQIAILKYSWPGNVRELENVIASAAMVGSGSFLDLPDLPAFLHKDAANAAPIENWKPSTLADAQSSHIAKVVDMAGNLTRAADILGISRTSLYRLLKRAAHRKTNRSGSEKSA
jgi:two-component system, NtrC family, response regulator HydG